MQPAEIQFSNRMDTRFSVEFYFNLFVKPIIFESNYGKGGNYEIQRGMETSKKVGNQFSNLFVH